MYLEGPNMVETLNGYIFSPEMSVGGTNTSGQNIEKQRADT